MIQEARNLIRDSYYLNKRLAFDDGRLGRAGIEGWISENSDRGEIFIKINSTDNKKDWFTNFNFFGTKIPYPEIMSENSKIRVHKGWQELYSQPNIREVFLNYINKSQAEIVIFFGHSLGGAIGSIAALDAKYNFKDKKIKNITWGAPSPGNKHWVESYNRYVDKTWRFVNGNDLVSKLPLFFPQPTERIQLGTRAFFPSIKDHRWANYVKYF